MGWNSEGHPRSLGWRIPPLNRAPAGASSFRNTLKRGRERIGLIAIDSEPEGSEEGT